MIVLSFLLKATAVRGGRAPAIATGSKQGGIQRAIGNFGEEFEQGCHWAEVVV